MTNGTVQINVFHCKWKYKFRISIVKAIVGRICIGKQHGTVSAFTARDLIRLKQNIEGENYESKKEIQRWNSSILRAQLILSMTIR